MVRSVILAPGDSYGASLARVVPTFVLDGARCIVIIGRFLLINPSETTELGTHSLFKTSDKCRVQVTMLPAKDSFAVAVGKRYFGASQVNIPSKK